MQRSDNHGVSNSSPCLPSSGIQGKDFRSIQEFCNSKRNGPSLPNPALSTFLGVCSFFPKNCASQTLLCEGILVVHDQRRLSYTPSPFMGANLNTMLYCSAHTGHGGKEGDFHVSPGIGGFSVSPCSHSLAKVLSLRVSNPETAWVLPIILKRASFRNSQEHKQNHCPCSPE